MMTYVVGDLFESPARVLVNTVNTVGVMGKGIAKDFKRIYPEMFRKYQELCEKKLLVVGKLWLYKTPNKCILNFPTKTTWRKSSKVEYIERGLEAFVNGYEKRGITSIAFPPLGCGNGELDWENQVRPLMERYLHQLPIDIFVHLYRPDPFVPEHRDINTMAKWLRSEPESLGFDEVWRDLTDLIGSEICLRTLTDDRPFRVERVSDGQEEGLCFHLDGKVHPAPQEDLLEFWSLLRNHGFSIADRMVPPGLVSVADPLIALFSHLPYCRPVKASTDYSTLASGNNIGLQWMPQAAKHKAFEQLSFEVQPA